MYELVVNISNIMFVMTYYGLIIEDMKEAVTTIYSKPICWVSGFSVTHMQQAFSNRSSPHAIDTY